jgi:hypothetical protein
VIPYPELFNRFEQESLTAESAASEGSYTEAFEALSRTSALADILYDIEPCPTPYKERLLAVASRVVRAYEALQSKLPQNEYALQMFELCVGRAEASITEERVRGWLFEAHRKSKFKGSLTESELKRLRQLMDRYDTQRDRLPQAFLARKR